MATRRLLLVAVAGLVMPVCGGATASEAAWAALRQGGLAVIRHANAPGVGDPPGLRLGDCTTQRNLDESGRAQARRIGAALQANGVIVGRVLASQWCRAMETAMLAVPGRVEPEPAFNSFFAARGTADTQTAMARDILRRWSGPGALVVFTHQVNIQALTGISPASGEAVVLVVEADGLRVVGRIAP